MNPLAVITGASSGIGMSLAREFAAHGYDLVVVARRAAPLTELAAQLPTEVTVVSLDLTKARAPRQLWKTASELQRPVDVLVNNAGAAHTGAFSAMRSTDVMAMVDLNVRVTTALTNLFLPAMLDRGKGKILNVASVAGFQAVPGMAVYSASKAYLLALTESLAEELQGSGVSVTALCPGLTNTRLAADVTVAGQAIPEFLMATPEAVAREGYNACQLREVVRVPGYANQALAGFSDLQPRWLTRRLAGVAARLAFSS